MSHFKILLFILLYLPLYAFSMPSLEIEVKNSVVEYGRPVTLTLTAVGLNKDLSLLRLDNLTSSFYIESRDLESEKLELVDEETGDEIFQQRLKLKMYPRQTGKLLIPAFTLEEVSSNQLELTILEARNSGHSIQLDSTTSSTQVWQREKILISLTLYTADEFATVKLAQQAVAGVEITALPVSRVWNENKNGGLSTIKTGWSLLPLRPGNSEIELPAVEYHLNGVVRRVFHLPNLKLNIRPLPSYLPPTIPVGKIKISSSISVRNSESTRLLYTDELAYWNVSIESKSLTPYWLPPVLRQIKPGKDISFFPAISTRSMQTDESGVNGRVSHSIPFKPLANGYTDIPSLEIKYFDPLTGRLETLVHQTEPSFSFGIFSRITVTLFFVVFILVLARQIFAYITGRIRYRKKRQQAVLKIRQANTTKDAVIGIRMVSKTEGWPANISLTNWLQRWKKQYHSAPELDGIIQSLSLMHYDSKNKVNLQENLGEITARLAKFVATEN